MQTLTVSSKFQLVIPPVICKSLGVVPGQKMQALEHDGRIELIPIDSIQSARGFLKGIDSRIERDGDRIECC